MNIAATGDAHGLVALDSGLPALCCISAYYRIPANPLELQRELLLAGKQSDFPDLLRAAGLIGLKARWVSNLSRKRFGTIPTPCLVRLRGSHIQVYGGKTPAGLYRLFDPVSRKTYDLELEELLRIVEPQALLITKKTNGPGVTPSTFSWRWFLPSIWRYREP